jgi:DNA-binding MarR family transcriptional regulator
MTARKRAIPVKTGRRSRNRHSLRILNAIRQIIRAADIDSRQLAADHQITAPQLVSLMAVTEETEPTTAIDVARRVHLSPSTLVGVLDRLEAKGLIRRKRDPHDRRQIWIAATAAGRAVVTSTPFPLQHSLDRALRRMPEAERRQVAESMDRLAKLMAVDEIDASPMLEIVAVGTRQAKGEV